MPDPSPAGSDLRPEIVVCVCDPTVEAALADASALSVGLTNARASRMDVSDPEVMADAVEGRLRDPGCRALLIVGRTRDGGFRIQTRAENKTLNGKSRFHPTGPGVVRATASAQEIVRALTDAGETAEVTSQSDEDVASYLLFRALCGLPDGIDAPAVGLLRVPSGDADRAGAGLQAAMSAIARHLSPAPRAASS